jgi:uncharacterized protein (DUF362 family)
MQVDVDSDAKSQPHRHAQYRHTHVSRTNLALACSAALLGALLIWQEGYGSLLRWPFALYSGFVFAVTIWVGVFDITTKRLLALFAVASVFGLVTQWVGASKNAFWIYARPSYGIAAPMFMFAAAFSYGLTVSKLAPALRRFGLAGRVKIWQGVLLLGAVFFVLFVDAPGAKLIDPMSFWLYCTALGMVALLLMWLADLATVLSLFVAGIVVGSLSETLGAASGFWSFGERGIWPPVFLVFAFWPLETALHWTLSAALVRQSPLPSRRHFTEPPTYQPLTSHPMWTGGKAQPVVVAEGNDKFTLLGQAIEQAGLKQALEARMKALGVSAEELRIAIKSNFMFMYSEHDRSTFTDPALVEHLIDWLRERGFSRISVVEAQSAYGNFFLDREVHNVARLIGYDPKGRYEIHDLTLDKVEHTFQGPLGKHWVGKAWRDSDFRISFAKNKTHTWAWYTLTLKNIYGALPQQDKIREYHYLREIYSPTIDLLVDFPVHFGVIDAFESADGPFGIFADREPNATRTLIAGENLLAVDWVGARKMGLDPMLSRYMQLAVQVFGKPEPQVLGSLEVYEPWRNVPKEVIDFWDTAEESYGFTNTVFHLLNREYMSPAFRRRPATKLLRLLLPIVAPFGGLVFQDPRPRSPSDENRQGTR